ncbi:MAG TPA: DASS family sodium-coupled anion symporter [Chlamydiales bacterium]|nr:DASS family sodium-coupled anion symporter [Chlamydiales bacterium]
MNKKTAISFSISLLIGVVLWFLPTPDGLKKEAWHLFAIFAASIVGIILKPFPMGVIAIFSLTVSILTHTLTFADAFSGFSNDIVWLVVFAFFISRGFISSGLGNRIAYKIMSLIGKNSLGLGYGLVATDLVIAPLIPSLTARGGGIIYPLLKSLSDIFTGNSHDPKMGAFLTLAAFQGMVITSAMFLTSMAGNPLIAELAKSRGVELTWTGWAAAAIVPGLISLALIPYVIFRLVSPTIRQTPHARDMALEKIARMGPMKRQEWIMLATFFLLITLWIAGNFIGIKATVSAMAGLSILLFSGVLRWKEILEEQSAWNTFIWFATLVTLPSFLNKYGFSSWFSEWIVIRVAGFEWVAGFCFIALIYFYSHYLFASNVGHITAMYAPFLIVAIALGTPPELAALVLGFFSSLFGGLTHYGSGPAPILFGTGYVTVSQWWKIGGVAGAINIFIWMAIGGIWWKILGLW